MVLMSIRYDPEGTPAGCLLSSSMESRQELSEISGEGQLFRPSHWHRPLAISPNGRYMGFAIYRLALRGGEMLYHMRFRAVLLPDVEQSAVAIKATSNCRLSRQLHHHPVARTPGQGACCGI